MLPLCLTVFFLSLSLIEGAFLFNRSRGIFQVIPLQVFRYDTKGSLFLVFDPKVVQDRLEIVLHQQAGIAQITGHFVPLFQTAIVKHFMPVVDDEGDDPETKAFLKKDQSADAPVAVLKGMDALETNMKVKQIIQRFICAAVILLQELCHRRRDLGRERRGLPADLVGDLFISPDCKPGLSAVAGAVFQSAVKLFDKGFRQRLRGVINDQVDAAEMVGGLHHIIYIDTLALKAKGVRLEDITGLVVGEAAALDMVRVVGHIDLYLVIDPAAQLHFLLCAQPLQQCLRQGLPFVDALRPFSVLGDLPGFSLQNRAGNAVVGTVIAHRAFCHTPLRRSFGNRNQIHAYHLAHSIHRYRQEVNRSCLIFNFSCR